LEDVTVNLDRLDLAGRTSPIRCMSAPRSPGPHLSGVLRYILRTARLPGWERYDEEIDADSVPLLWCMGIMWEEFVLSLYPGLIWQPGERCLSGVFMTCDALNWLDGENEMILEEAKYTSAKPRTGEEFCQDWLKQMQGRGYCAGYQLRVCRWHVLYNYNPREPVYKRFAIRYSDREIADTERTVLANRDAAVKAGYAEGVTACSA